MDKIAVNNLYKIFGLNSKRAIQLARTNVAKQEILKQTGATVAVNDVSFSVKEGETFVIMGLSGSGKSTVVRCLNRLVEATAGEIIINGEDIRRMNKAELIAARRSWLGMVFQNFALLENRDIIGNVSFGLELKGVKPKERRQKALTAINLVGLDGYETSLPNQLSGGMKQRVGLARALANDVEILLMDEAFSALDPLIRADMQDELIDLQKKMKKTIIFITHDLDEALKLGDRIMIMKDGQCIQIGTPEEILSQPADDYVKRFVQGVDRSTILTARNVVTKPWTVVRMGRGPHWALKEMNKYGLDQLLVVSEQGRKLLGGIRKAEVEKAIARREQTIENIVDPALPNRVEADCGINELIRLTSEDMTPLSVVDQDNKLLGIIVRTSVLSALNSARDLSG